MPADARDFQEAPWGAGVVHLDSVDPMVSRADPSAKWSAIAHELPRERGEVMVFFSVDGAESRIVALQGVVASLDLYDNDRFFLKGDDVGLKPR